MMKNKSTIAYAFCILVLTFAISALLKATVESLLAGPEKIIVDEIIKKSQKALILDDFNELDEFKSSLNTDTIGYTLKNARGETIDSLHSRTNAATTSYSTTISTTYNSVSSLLIEHIDVALPKHDIIANTTIGYLDVDFTHNNVLINYHYIIAFILSVLAALSVKAFTLNAKANKLKRDIKKLTKESKHLNIQFNFYSETLKSIFSTLSTDFKIANDVLAYSSTKKNESNDYVVSYAKNKMNRSLHSLLEIEEKVLNFNPETAKYEKVYFFGSMDKIQVLKLCFQVNNIDLAHLNKLQTQTSTIEPTVLIDLDPLVHDYDTISNVISSIATDAYIVGILPSEPSDKLPDCISLRLNWTLIQPIDIDEYIKTIKNKPSVRKLIDSAI